LLLSGIGAPPAPPEEIAQFPSSDHVLSTSPTKYLLLLAGEELLQEQEQELEKLELQEQEQELEKLELQEQELQELKLELELELELEKEDEEEEEEEEGGSFAYSTSISS